MDVDPEFPAITRAARGPRVEELEAGKVETGRLEPSGYKDAPERRMGGLRGAPRL